MPSFAQEEINTKVALVPRRWLKLGLPFVWLKNWRPSTTFMQMLSKVLDAHHV